MEIFLSRKTWRNVRSSTSRRVSLDQTNLVGRSSCDRRIDFGFDRRSMCEKKTVQPWRSSLSFIFFVTDEPIPSEQAVTELVFESNGRPINLNRQRTKSRSISPDQRQSRLDGLSSVCSSTCSSVYCSLCEKILSDDDFFVKTRRSIDPIVCLFCFENLISMKCRRCEKNIEFQGSSTKLRLTNKRKSCSISEEKREDQFYLVNRFVEHEDHFWHLDCSTCIVCSQPLLDQAFRFDRKRKELRCVDHWTMRRFHLFRSSFE